jgi:hypothetical protein
MSSFIRRTLKCFLIAIAGLSALKTVASAQECLQRSLNPGANYFETTGNPILDQQLNTEAIAVDMVFGISPNLLIFDDGDQPNAYAVPYRTRFGTSGTVCLGVRLLVDELGSIDKGGYAVAGILAHEFSHILQARLHSRLSGKFRELHADYMAGYYLGKRSMIAPTDIRNFAVSLYEKGDFAFWSSTHHGTPEERVIAMVAGFRNSGASLDEAFFHGEKILLQAANNE